LPYTTLYRSGCSRNKYSKKKPRKKHSKKQQRQDSTKKKHSKKTARQGGTLNMYYTSSITDNDKLLNQSTITAKRLNHSLASRTTDNMPKSSKDYHRSGSRLSQVTRDKRQASGLSRPPPSCFHRRRPPVEASQLQPQQTRPHRCLDRA